MPKIFDYKKFYGLAEKEKISNWFLKQTEERMNNHLNFNCAVVGDTGSGKSYLALRIGELISKRFNTPFTIEQVLFDPTKVYHLVKTLPAKSVIMFDESSVSLDAHKWMTTTNKLLSHLTETYRFKQFVTIFCLPSLHMLDSRVRSVVHALIRMYGQKCEEARVYKLVATHLGSQHLRGVGTIRNAKLPNYEQCKRLSCKNCPKFNTCSLLRGQYERKKAEAFDELLAYTQFRLSQLPFDRLVSGSPYGFKEKMRMTGRDEYGEDVLIDDEEENE